MQVSDRAPASSVIVPTQGYVVRFESLYRAGTAYEFPCDANGNVLADKLSAPAWRSYVTVRSKVGREFSTPKVRTSPSY